MSWFTLSGPNIILTLIDYYLSPTPTILLTVVCCFIGQYFGYSFRKVGFICSFITLGICSVGIYIIGYQNESFHSFYNPWIVMFSVFIRWIILFPVYYIMVCEISDLKLLINSLMETIIIFYCVLFMPYFVMNIITEINDMRSIYMFL